MAKITIGAFAIAHHIIDIRMTVGSWLNEILKKLAAGCLSAQYIWVMPLAEPTFL